MTLPHTCESSVTKIQRPSVHSIFVSFPPFKRHSSQQSAILKPFLFWLLLSNGASVGGGNVFAKQMEKLHCVAHTHGNTYFHLVILQPALTFSHLLQSELMCQSCSFLLKTDVAGTSN